MRRKIAREDIIEAGRDLMFEKGYSGTGIKDITDEIAIPKGSFYNHFPSKEAFGLEMLKQYIDNGTKLYKTRLLDENIPPLERLQKFFDYLTDQYRLHMEFKLGCLMGNFSAELADINDSFRASIEEGFKTHEGVFVECLKQAQKKGEIAKDHDCALLGSFMLNSWHGAILRMKATQNAKPLEDFKTIVFDQLID